MSDDVTGELHLELAMRATCSAQLARALPHARIDPALDRLPRLLNHTDFRAVYNSKTRADTAIALAGCVTSFESLQVLARDRRISVREAVLQRDDLTAAQLIALDVDGDDFWSAYGKHTSRLLRENAVTGAQLRQLADRCTAVWPALARYLQTNWNSPLRGELLDVLGEYVIASQHASLLTLLADKPGLPLPLWREAVHGDLTARRNACRNLSVPLEQIAQVTNVTGLFDSAFAACVLRLLDEQGRTYRVDALTSALRTLTDSRERVTAGQFVATFLTGTPAPAAGEELFALEQLG